VKSNWQRQVAPSCPSNCPSDSPSDRATRPGSDDVSSTAYDFLLRTVAGVRCGRGSAPAEIDPAGYAELLAQAKRQIQTARTRAALALNAELHRPVLAARPLIVERQRAARWGSKVIDRLSADLRSEFPGMRGPSVSRVLGRAFGDAFPRSGTLPIRLIVRGAAAVDRVSRCRHDRPTVQNEATAGRGRTHELALAPVRCQRTASLCLSRRPARCDQPAWARR
jgi:DUF1016 N-terminal domain